MFYIFKVTYMQLTEIAKEVKYRINEVGKVCEEMKKVFKCKSLQMNAKRRPCEGIMVPTALYGAET